MERGGYSPRNRGAGRGYGRYGRGRGRGGIQRPSQDAFDGGRRGGRSSGGRRGGFHHQQQWMERTTPYGGGRTQSPSESGIPPSIPIPTPSNPPPPSRDVVQVPNLPMVEQSDSEKKISPIRRPDSGGKEFFRETKLQVNHFLVNFDRNAIIYHHNVDVKVKEPPGEAQPPKRITKSELSMIREKLFDEYLDRIPLEMTAYDGEKSIFSKVKLPLGEFTVNGGRATYEVTLTFVNTLELSKLDDYINGRAFSIPRVTLQGVDLVFKENPVKNTVSVGRCFYPMNPTLVRENLQPGIIAVGGFQHSLKPTHQGLSLCLDYSVLPFRKSMPVLDFLHEHIEGFDLSDFGKFRSMVETALNGLKVKVTHRITKQKYTIAKLTVKSTRLTTFRAGDPPEDMNLLDYFLNKYGVDVTNKDIPALVFAGNGNYVPMELCVLAEGQRYPMDHLSRDAAKKLKDKSVLDPQDRKGLIEKMVDSDHGPCGGGIINNFEMNVNTSMTTVTGRVIGPPELKLGDPKGSTIKMTLSPFKCDWNLLGRSLVESKPVECWGIVDFTGKGKGAFDHRTFILEFVKKYRKMGIDMSQPAWIEKTDMLKLQKFDSLRELLENINEKVHEKYRRHLQFLLCVMARKDPCYKWLKWISETKVGIVTQCCLSSNANPHKKNIDQYLTNLALKINAKIGGSNVELFNRLPHFEGGGHVMFIGADVNHPGSRDTSSPSIAAVVGTVNWPAANRYAARVCAQDHRIEKILNFGQVCLELVGYYESLNNVRPEKIVIFRDGVSESQFQMVLGEELQDLKSVFERSNYFPTITLIVAQKRHQTRLFLAGSTENVFPGTVVDTDIIHPFEFDFYLVSHSGRLGTSKPTHYHVLWDENEFTSDKLQKLIYDMCFTFARCTKPVSLVPPVYYADLAAYRGRLYHDAKVEVQSPQSSASSSSSSSRMAKSSSSASFSNDADCYKLHADLENSMFFV